MRIKYPVVLASQSPRRQELLKALVPEFTIDVPDVDEDALTLNDPAQTAQRLAKEKALVVFERHPDSLVIAGDTVVCLDNTQLAKPVDQADACRMLGLLSGRTHTVITGLALRWPGGLIAITDSTEVTFRTLSASEIEEYVATGEPMDKAGAYGIQAGGGTFIESVKGSVNNVIGLPTEKLQEALQQVK